MLDQLLHENLKDESSSTSRIKDRKFRPDVEGLRAVAVLLVVLYHAGVPFLPGGFVGVDVFFVISGFLITRMLLTELESRGKISFSRFYARRIKRLLPASAFISLVTLISVWLWVPSIRIKEIAVDALSTLFYGANYRFALSGAEYSASENDPSPFQHFWSLAVEEQFYFVWPALMVIASLAVFRKNINRLALTVILMIVMAGSLALSVWQTGVSQPWAFFGLHTRAWELALGALVAVAIPWLLKLERIAASVVGAVLSWLGLVSIVVSAVHLSTNTLYPSYWVVWPVVSTAIVIAGGVLAHRGSAELLLKLWPFQKIGEVSYSWYLWHWPVLILLPYILKETPTTKDVVFAVLLSLVFASVSYVIVERPIRQKEILSIRPLRGFVMGGFVSMLVALVSLLAVVFGASAVTGSGESVLLPDKVNADSLAAVVKKSIGITNAPSNLTPSVSDVAKDRHPIYSNGCHLRLADSTVKNCEFGDLSSSKTIVLYGDSHAAHWLPALEQAAKDRHWKLVLMTKDACASPQVPISLKELGNRQYSECDNWRTDSIKSIEKIKPALVVVSFNSTVSSSLLVDTITPVDKQWSIALSSLVVKIRNAGSQAVFLEDTPWPKSKVPVCVSEHMTSVNACMRSRQQAVAEPLRREGMKISAKNAGARVVDPTPWLCADSCPVIIGNLLVYRDQSHLTTAFAKWVSPVVGTEIAKGL